MGKGGSRGRGKGKEKSKEIAAASPSPPLAKSKHKSQSQPQPQSKLQSSREDTKRSTKATKIKTKPKNDPAASCSSSSAASSSSSSSPSVADPGYETDDAFWLRCPSSSPLSTFLRDPELDLGGEAEAYIRRFEEEAVALNHLPHLDHELLKQLGVVKMGHRIDILKKAKEMSDYGVGVASL